MTTTTQRHTKGNAMKTAPLPIIDLGGSLKVIDESTDPPRWKTVCRLPVASRSHAFGAMRDNGLQTAWLVDELGYRELLTI